MIGSQLYCSIVLFTIKMHEFYIFLLILFLIYYIEFLIKTLLIY